MYVITVHILRFNKVEATHLRDECIAHSNKLATLNNKDRNKNAHNLSDVRNQIYYEKIPQSILERIEGKSNSAIRGP